MDDSNSHWPKGHPAAAADRQAASPDEAGARLAAIRHEIDAVDQDLPDTHPRFAQRPIHTHHRADLNQPQRPTYRKPKDEQREHRQLPQP